MRTAARMLAIVAAALALLFQALPATAQARHGGHHRWHGHSHWGVGIGIGLGTYYDPWWRPYPGYPPYVIVELPPVAYSAVPAAPDPVFTPRNGQSAAQTEADRQACNRWATTQPEAMADAGVFHRSTLACMDGRGYTVR
ncbi:MAG TPA: hypothetical protein VJ598_00270 [Albitalea sp.]|nr:hypothetical protein [Albitalea sp.]